MCALSSCPTNSAVTDNVERGGSRWFPTYPFPTAARVTRWTARLALYSMHTAGLQLHVVPLLAYHACMGLLPCIHTFIAGSFRRQNDYVFLIVATVQGPCANISCEQAGHNCSDAASFCLTVPHSRNYGEVHQIHIKYVIPDGCDPGDLHNTALRGKRKSDDFCNSPNTGAAW